ncbi:hypothetical protein YC2023_074565 [Brassica napus]
MQLTNSVQNACRMKLLHMIIRKRQLLIWAHAKNRATYHISRELGPTHTPRGKRFNFLLSEAGGKKSKTYARAR